MSFPEPLSSGKRSPYVSTPEPETAKTDETSKKRASTAAPSAKDISTTISNLGKEALATQKMFTDHVVLFKTGEMGQDTTNAKLSELGSKLDQLEEKAKAVGTELTKIKPGEKHQELSANLSVLRAQIDSLKAQKTQIQDEASKMEHTTRQNVNQLLLEGAKDPLKAAANYQAARAKLELAGPDRFPDLKQKLDAFTDRATKLSPRERAMERKLDDSEGKYINGKISDKKISSKDAHLIESVVRKKALDIALEPDSAKKQQKFEKFYTLTKGLTTFPALHSHLEKASQGELKDDFVRKSLSYDGISGSNLLFFLNEVDTKKVDAFPTIEVGKAAPKETSTKPAALGSSAKLTSKEKKEVSFKISLITFLLNLPVGRIAKKLDTVAQNTLKIEKEIDKEMRALVGKSAEELEHANDKQIDTINQMIKGEKANLASLKQELISKSPSKLGLDVEKAIAKQELVIERLEAKKNILEAHSGKDYREALAFSKEIEEALNKSAKNKEANGEAFFEATLAQTRLEEKVKDAQGPLKPKMEELLKTASERIVAQSDQVQLTSAQVKIRDQILGGNNLADLKDGVRLKEEALRNILAKEIMVAKFSTGEAKEEAYNRIAQLRAHINRADPSILSSTGLSKRETLSEMKKEYDLVANEYEREAFFNTRFAMMEIIKKAGSGTEKGAQLDTLRANSIQISNIAQKFPSLQSLNASAQVMLKVYTESIELSTKQKRLSKDLSENKGIKSNQQDQARKLLIKESALAMGDNLEKTDAFIKTLSRLQVAEGKLSVADNVKAFFSRDRSKTVEAKSKEIASKVLTKVMSDPAVLKNIRTLRQESETRIQQTLVELKEIKNPEEYIDKLNGLKIEFERLNALSADQEVKGTNLYANAFKDLLKTQLNEIDKISPDDLEANLKQLLIVNQRLFLQGVEGLPGKAGTAVKDQVKGDTEIKAKLESLIPRFVGLIGKNQKSEKAALLDFQLTKLAGGFKVDAAKLAPLEVFKKDRNFVQSYQEMREASQTEYTMANEKYEMVEKQLEDLKGAFSEQEHGQLTAYLVGFKAYLDKAKVLNDRIQNETSDEPSSKNIAVLMQILSSPEHQEYLKAIEANFQTAKGMQAVTAKAKELVETNKGAIELPAGVQAIVTSELDRSSLVKHGMDRFLKWESLVGALGNELLKRTSDDAFVEEQKKHDKNFSGAKSALDVLQGDNKKAYDEQKSVLIKQYQENVKNSWDNKLRKMEAEGKTEDIAKMQEYRDTHLALIAQKIELEGKGAALNRSFPG